MKSLLCRAFTAALLVLLLPAASAMEGIADFVSDVAVQADGGLTVSETITVRVEGNRIKRGIFRDFPTRYDNHRGARVVVPFEVVSVQRDGQPENYSLESLKNGVRVRIGRAEHLLEHGVHTYRIEYRTARQLGFFDQHDELYWNVTGNGWEFVIAHASARVRLPQPVPAAQLRAEFYTGPQGAQGRDATATLADGEFRFETTRALGPYEGLTIVAMFPKGIVTAPTDAERMRWMMEDNAGELVALASVIAVIVFLFVLWWMIGRDPRPGPLFPRYDAPDGMSPAAVRFVDNMGFDNTCLAAALLGLGARGFVKIEQDGDQFVVRQTGRPLTGWLAGDKPMSEALFASRTQAILSKTYDPKVASAQSALKGALKRHYKGTLFKLNSWPIWLAIMGAAFGLMAGLGLDAQPPAMIALAVVAIAALFIFAKLMPRYTREGRRVQDHIEGLRQYLGVAERDDLARMKAPQLTPVEFARMLPYALALGVEKTWADRFAAALGTAAVSAAVASYYSGDFGSWSSPGSGLANSLGSLGSTVSSASTAPGSSSGGGGGGSSGGGGGGGGGGGW